MAPSPAAGAISLGKINTPELSVGLAGDGSGRHARADEVFRTFRAFRFGTRIRARAASAPRVGWGPT